MTRQRVTASDGALYSKPRKNQKRRRCAGHLVDRHYIEPGDLAVWCALPPDDPEINNDRWMHHVLCVQCAPAHTIDEPRTAPVDAMSRSTAEQVLLAYSRHRGPIDGDWQRVHRLARAATHPDKHYGARKELDAVEAAAAVLGLIQ